MFHLKRIETSHKFINTNEKHNIICLINVKNFSIKITTFV